MGMIATDMFTLSCKMDQHGVRAHREPEPIVLIVLVIVSSRGVNHAVRGYFVHLTWHAWTKTYVLKRTMLQTTNEREMAMTIL